MKNVSRASALNMYVLIRIHLEVDEVSVSLCLCYRIGEVGICVRAHMKAVKQKNIHSYATHTCGRSANRWK